MATQPIITRDRGIWAVRYVIDDRPLYFVETDLEPTDLSSRVWEYIRRNKVTHIQHGMGEMVSPDMVGEDYFSDVLNYIHRVWGSTRLVMDYGDRTYCSLEFHAGVYPPRTGRIPAPEKGFRVKYDFLEGDWRWGEERGPFEREMVFLNSISKHARTHSDGGIGTGKEHKLP